MASTGAKVFALCRDQWTGSRESVYAHAFDYIMCVELFDSHREKFDLSRSMPIKREFIDTIN